MANAPSGQGAADLAVIRALFAGKPGAWAVFIDRVKDDVYTACRLVCAPDEVDQAFVLSPAGAARSAGPAGRAALRARPQRRLARVRGLLQDGYRAHRRALL